jgi:hypothetical protein
MGAGRAIPAGLAALCLAAAVLPALFGVNLVSYALGNPDTPRYFVGLYALVGLGVAGTLLHVAGLQLRRLGWAAAVRRTRRRPTSSSAAPPRAGRAAPRTVRAAPAASMARPAE